MMRSADWVRVLNQAVELGVQVVQFIGGEPTLYPDLAHLVDHALQRGLAVEVFSNLVHVTDELWQVFGRPGVSLATSYYSDDPAQHAAITGRPSYARTRANIAEVIRRGIPLRVGLIDLGDGQRTEAAQRELAEILTGPDAERIWNQLAQAFAERAARACRPSCGPTCEPNRCTPDCAPACSPAHCHPTCAPSCGPSCNPCAPSTRCWPSYGGCLPHKESGPSRRH